jgi:prepilin-type N-terminal cleavage/methylation domain-containing protein
MKAFTLLELMIVVGVLALVSGFAVLAYTGVREETEYNLAERQVALVRDALVRFRQDMGYYPGEGPLQVGFLNLNNIGGQARSEDWAAHPMNFWMLFEKPIDAVDPNRWDWKPGVARGWRGPYLTLPINARLDGSGEAEWLFAEGSSHSDLFAVGDLLGHNDRLPGAMRWRDPSTGEPYTRNVPLGNPLAFEIDRSVPNWRIYRLHSPGREGQYKAINDPSGARSQIVIEVARRPL